MRIPTWRIALTGVAIVVLLALGIGFAAASSNVPQSSGSAAQGAHTAAPDASGGPNGPAAGGGIRKWLLEHPRIAARLAGRLGAARHLVHVVGTFTDKDGNLVTIQLDHGTVQAVGGGSLTIAEAGGTTVTVSTDDQTKVFTGRTAGQLGDVKVGATVFVQSRIDGSTLAKRILIVPAGSTDSGS
ncbi:MAG TPA: hypothetical protein VF484_10345 [Candidatus Limnocylindrales bacterium]